MSATPDTEQPNNAPLGNVAEAFRGAMVESLGVPEAVPNPIKELLSEHFGGADPEQLPSVTDSYGTHLHLNFQFALEEFLGEDGRTHSITGVHCPSATGDPGATSLALLLTDASFAWAPVVYTPAEYQVVDCSSTDTKACLKQGLILFNDADGPGCIWVRGMLMNRIMIDVMHASREKATGLLARFRERGIELSPYHGQVIEIGFDSMFAPRISFLPRPEHTEADQVILPPGLLEEIEEHSVEVLRARTALEASGRHMKRGLLLHGKPGTGKTHTIRYLISQMPEATVAVMSGTRMLSPFPGSTLQPLNLITDVLNVIVPGVIVLDDIDFIAESRTMPGMTPTRDELFALLELLDGINDDADLLFVMTTNRPNTLEPAVAARPGRIDQAVEVPLPDEGCRRRLVELYTRDLAATIGDDDLDTFIERTEGVTASFIRESVRRAAVTSVLTEGTDIEETPKITGEGLLRALDELLDPTNPLTPILLGAEPEHALATLQQITGGGDDPRPEAPDDGAGFFAG